MDGARQGKKKDFFPLAEERSSKGISLSWEKKKNVGLIEGIRLKTKRRDQGEGARRALATERAADLKLL